MFIKTMGQCQNYLMLTIMSVVKIQCVSVTWPSAVTHLFKVCVFSTTSNIPATDLFEPCSAKFVQIVMPHSWHLVKQVNTYSQMKIPQAFS